MSGESGKQVMRRLSDHRFATRWFVGDGIDIGFGAAPLCDFAGFFPSMKSLRTWRTSDGDVTAMASVSAASYDFVHSNHCLEHLTDPARALQNWIRICRPNGHLIITVPDEDLYEQGVWPSVVDPEHQWTFTILKKRSWSPKSVSLFALLERFAADVEVLKIEKLDAGFDYRKTSQDPLRDALSESGIEFVLRKRGAPAAAQTVEEKDIGVLFPRVARGQQIADLFQVAVGHHSAGRFDDARVAYRMLLEADPENLAALNNYALLLDQNSAINVLRRIVTLKPDYRDALLNLGSLLHRSGNDEEAIRHLQEAHRQGKDARAALLLCQIFLAADDFAGMTRVLNAMPDADSCSVGELVRLASYCQFANLIDMAQFLLDKALQREPDDADAHRARARLLRQLGQHTAATEAFFRAARRQAVAIPAGLFGGEDGVPRRQDGKTVVVLADGTLEETILFVRYAKDIKALGARVVLACQKDLIGLVDKLDYVDAVLDSDAALADDAVVVPMSCLPTAFRSIADSIPNECPYLRADPADSAFFRERCDADGPGLRVAVFLSQSSPWPRHDGPRGPRLELLSSWFGLGGVVWYVVHHQDAQRFPMLHDLSQEVTSLATAAGLIECMDLIVTVDSPIAHLAGALAKPVCLLNRADSGWPWREVASGRGWYPTMREFRQARAGDWGAVIEAAGHELHRLLEEKK